MTNSTITLVAAIIAACAALAAAIISAATSRSLSRRTGSLKLAEFRKEWIENLRMHFAEFLSVWFSINVARRQRNDAKTTEEKDQFNKVILSKYERLSYLQLYILLMLNPEEDLHQQMKRKMKEMSKRLGAEKPDEENKEKSEGQKTPIFSELAGKILKAEWNRLKTETKGN